MRGRKRLLGHDSNSRTKNGIQVHGRNTGDDLELKRRNINVSAGRFPYEKAKSRGDRHRRALAAHRDTSKAVPLKETQRPRKRLLVEQDNSSSRGNGCCGVHGVDDEEEAACFLKEKAWKRMALIRESAKVNSDNATTGSFVVSRKRSVPSPSTRHQEGGSPPRKRSTVSLSSRPSSTARKPSAVTSSNRDSSTTVADHSQSSTSRIAKVPSIQAIDLTYDTDEDAPLTTGSGCHIDHI